jgi:predicted nuclease with TOPRIM domain
LDNGTIVPQFEEIEKKVETIIDAFKALEATNAELTTRIGRLEAELQGKAEAEERFERERALIRNKIDGLLSRLESVAHAPEQR